MPRQTKAQRNALRRARHKKKRDNEIRSNQRKQSDQAFQEHWAQCEQMRARSKTYREEQNYKKAQHS